MRAMIFAAGLGTRLQTMTANNPKALVEIAGKTLLEHAITYLKGFGVSYLVVNVHHYADQIINFLNEKENFGITIHISDERDGLLDTGGGIKKAAEFFPGEEPVVLYNVDIFSDMNLSELVDFHLAANAMATVVVRDRETSRYLLFNRQNQLVGWKNIQSGEVKVSRPGEIDLAINLAFSGIHVISPEIFNQITESGKFSIIDLYLRLAQHQTIKGFIDQSKYWLDLGKANQITEAEKIIGEFMKSQKA